MAKYTFTIPGKPEGQGRPRFRTITAKDGRSFATAYDPKQSRNWKQTVCATAIAHGVKQIDGPVRLIVRAFLPRPQRLCRKADPIGPVFALCKPDFDNIAKGISDALFGVAFADDAAVVSGHCQKFYHEIGGMPRTEVIVESLQTPTPQKASEQ